MKLAKRTPPRSQRKAEPQMAVSAKAKSDQWIGRSISLSSVDDQPTVASLEHMIRQNHHLSPLGPNIGERNRDGSVRMRMHSLESFPKAQNSPPQELRGMSSTNLLDHLHVSSSCTMASISTKLQTSVASLLEQRLHETLPSPYPHDISVSTASLLLQQQLLDLEDSIRAAKERLAAFPQHPSWLLPPNNRP